MATGGTWDVAGRFSEIADRARILPAEDFDDLRWLIVQLRAARAELEELTAESEGFDEAGRRVTAKLMASEARNAALLRALEPFADIDGDGDEDFPDGTKVTVMFGRTTSYSLTLGDFRKARAATAKG